MNEDRLLQGFEYELPKGETVHSEEDDKKRRRLLRLLNRADEVKIILHDEWEKIQDDYDLAGNVKTGELDSAELIHSHYTRTTTKKIVQKLDFPQYDISLVMDETENEEAEKVTKEIIKATIDKLLLDGKIFDSFKGKGGSYFKSVLFGDAFIMPKWDDNKKMVTAEVHSLDDVYLDPKATSMRNSPDGLNVERCAIVYTYDDFDDFMEKFGNTCKKKDIEAVQWGRVPDTEEKFKKVSTTNAQENSDTDNKEGQVVMEIDMNCDEVIYYAGENLAIIKRVPYPYFIEEGGQKTKYIPLFHLFFSQRSSGFYNDGIGHLLSERTNADTSIKNAVLQGARNSALPLRVLNVQEGKENVVDNRIGQAIADIADGSRPGIVYNSISKDGISTIGGKIENLTGEMTRTEPMNLVNDMILGDIVNLGVNLRDVNSEASKTAYAVKEDNIAGTEVVAEFIRQNAPEITYFLDAFIALSKKMISPSDTRPVKIKGELSEQYGMTKATVGEGIKLMREIDIEVMLNAETGVTPDATLSRQKAMELMTVIAQFAPNSPVFKKTLLQFLESNDIEASEEDLAMAQEAIPQEAMQGQAPQQPLQQPL